LHIPRFWAQKFAHTSQVWPVFRHIYHDVDGYPKKPQRGDAPGPPKPKLVVGVGKFIFAEHIGV
jgi:hypothetical protein